MAWVYFCCADLLSPFLNCSLSLRCACYSIHASRMCLCMVHTSMLIPTSHPGAQACPPELHARWRITHVASAWRPWPTRTTQLFSALAAGRQRRLQCGGASAGFRVQHVRPGCHDQCERFVMKPESVEQRGGARVRGIQGGCSTSRGHRRARTPAAEL